MNVNAGMAKLVNLGARMDQARGERCEGVKKEGYIKRQKKRLNFYVTSMIYNENMKGDTELLAQGLAHAGRTIRKR